MFSARFQFDEAFIRRGLRRDHVGRLIYLGLLLVVIGAVAVWVGDFRPGIGWLLLGTLAVALFVKEREFRARVEQTVALWHRQSPSGEVGFEADADGLVVVTDLGSQRHPWSSIARLRQWTGVWGLESRAGQLLLFPVDSVPPAMAAFVADRARSVPTSA